VEWTIGMVEWKIFKSLFLNLHPNKGHIHISQHINTLYVLNKVSINSSNDGNIKKTLDLTLTYNHIVAKLKTKLMEVFEYPIW